MTARPPGFSTRLISRIMSWGRWNNCLKDEREGMIIIIIIIIILIIIFKDHR